MKTLLALFTILISTHSQALISKDSLSEPLTIEALDSFIKKNKINTIEKYLKKIPIELKKRYILVHSSQSAQGSNFQEPRVIMYSKNAQFMHSYSGGPHHRGGDKIELFLFNEKNEFEAHELIFEKDQYKLNKNPRLCVGCHGDPLTPNIGTYNYWDLTYGSNNNHLTARVKDPQEIPNTKEYDELQKFFKTYKTHPRYQYLPNLEERFGLDREIMTPADLLRKPLPQTKGLANLEISELISQLNFKRMIEVLKEMTEYSKFKYAFLSMMTCNYRQFKNSLGNVDLKVEHLPFYNLSDYKDPIKVGPIFDRYLNAFKDYFKINHRKFDTNFMFRYLKRQDGSDLYEELTRFSTPGNSGEEFAALLVQADPDFKDFVLSRSKVFMFKDAGIDRVRVNCESLSAKSASMLSL